jgi:hypothetical protein
MKSKPTVEYQIEVKYQMELESEGLGREEMQYEHRPWCCVKTDYKGEPRE